MPAYDPPFRVTPALPPQAMVSYRIHSPRDTAVKTACEQVGCAAWRHGWETVIDESTPLGQFQASYIRTQSGRTFTEHRSTDRSSVSASWNPPTEPVVTPLTVFRFEAGQRCFDEHVTLPERFATVGGDHRGNPTGFRRVHVRAADWVEDCGLNLQAWKEATERG